MEHARAKEAEGRFVSFLFESYQAVIGDSLSYSSLVCGKAQFAKFVKYYLGLNESQSTDIFMLLNKRLA